MTWAPQKRCFRRRKPESNFQSGVKTSHPRARPSPTCPTPGSGSRTKLIVEPFVAALTKHGVADEKLVLETAMNIADKLAKLDAKSLKEGGVPQVGTLVFLASSEIEAIAAKVAEFLKEKPSAKEYEKNLEKFCKSVGLADGADIAIFGRMAASLPSLRWKGRQCSATHFRPTNRITTWTSIQQWMISNPLGEDAGAGMIGTLEFSSAVYYRYAALNLDLLADQSHLGALTTGRTPKGRRRIYQGDPRGDSRCSQKLHERPRETIVRSWNIQVCGAAGPVNQRI